MKLYIPELSIYNNSPEQLHMEPFANYKETKFYCSNGIFQVVHDNKTNNTNIRKIHYVDKRKEEIILPTNQFIKSKQNNKNIGILDKTLMTLNETYFQLPLDYVKVETNIIKFRLRNNALVELVFHIEENLVKDIYFDLKETIQMHGVMEDVISFLSQLN